MCGIAGIISPQVNETLLHRMADSLAHRGPDGTGMWINDKNEAGFSHRRLAIIDLSKEGSQPMHYLNRYTIVFNGEIYNYPELRTELRKAGYMFRTTGDTEVILAAYDCYRSRCLHFLDGMFAFAIWDNHEKTLFAARDRFGEKPFYFWSHGNQLAFASEMKALWSVGVPRRLSERMILNYVALGQVQNPADKSQTFFEEIRSLPPAHYLIKKADDDKCQINQYWDLNKQKQSHFSEDQSIEYLNELMSESIFKRLRSDVPLGSSLSGGLDSSTIAWFALKLKGSGTDFKSFSARFPGFEKDESAFMDLLQQKLPHQNISVTPTAVELERDLKKLAWHQEEPITSSSVFAQFSVFRTAKENGTRVLLDGQGADETFAGYDKYAHWFLQELWNKRKFLTVHREIKQLRTNKVKFHWDIRNILSTMLPSHTSLILEKNEYLRILRHPDIQAQYLENLKGKEWNGISKPLVKSLNDILYFNCMKMGLEELLRFSDRSSMAHGVEVRLPFLSHKLVEFLFSLPAEFKIRNGYPKWILRKLMEKRLPAEIVWRKGKTGFEPPQKNWLSSPDIQELIMSSRTKLVNEKILKPSVLKKKIKPADAYELKNSDWRYLSLAALIS
jgi:asparagine synthase (glutamine-hydrolysing)